MRKSQKTRQAHTHGPRAVLLLAVLAMWSMPPDKASAQILPPLPGQLIVTITSPSSGATVSGTTTVNASVTIVGSLLVAGVQFKLDGANLGAQDTSAPYSVSWNTTGTSNGSHTLTAIARDALGVQWASNAVTVTVSNGPPPDTTAPTVSITSPSGGSTVSGTVTISATASDDVGVAGVEFFVDGNPFVVEDTTAPYSKPWDTTTVGNGTHTLTARARDAAGNSRLSSPVSVTVSNGPPPDTTAPTVSITSPAGGATVSATVTISATASDNVGVVGVQFFVDGTARGAEDTTAPYSVSWDTTTASNGSHSLTARARDAAGNSRLSSPVTVTVSNGPPPDTTAPTVSITSPAGGATVSGTVTISATASDDVDVAVVQFLVDGAELTRDGTAPYSAGWDTTTAANGAHTLQARAQDGAGNIGESAPVTVTVSNGPPPDTTAPTVSITSPAGGATVSGTVTISATATDNVDVAVVQFLVDGAELARDGTAPYSAGWDTTTAANGAHTLQARAQDGAGNIGESAPVTVTVSNGPPPDTTLHEETGATLAPAGAWSELTDAGASATLSSGRAVFAATAGATATFAFGGTGITWIGLPCEICGIAEVSLDGVLVATVDTFVPSRPAASQPVFTRSGLTAGAHTLTIEVTGTQNPSSGGAHVVVDAFDVEGDTSGGGGSTTRIEQDHPAVTYTGSWITQPHPDVSGGTGTESLEADATASLTFTGTGVSWIGFKATWAGIAEVFLDGTLRATVDSYSPVSQPQAVMYTASGLPDGSHTLTIRVTHTWNPKGEAAWVVVDAFDVTGEVGGAPPPPPAARSEESAAALSPASAWFGLTGAQTGVALSGDFAVLASETGATATFTFTGTEVAWIGFKCEQCGIATVRLDGVVVATVDTYAPSRPAASGAMFTSGPLAAGSHTLVIEVNGAANASSTGPFVVVDAFDVR